MIERVGLIVVAAGSSRRMGGRDKVWEHLGDAPVLAHSLRTLAPLASASVLVVRADRVSYARRELGSLVPELSIVAGGLERQESVRNGLEALPPTDIIAVHDAARPLVTGDVMLRGLTAVSSGDGAVPVLQLHDTIAAVAPDGTALHTLDRTTLRAVQTPQLFRTRALGEAHRAAAAAGHLGTDDASLLQRLGQCVVTYEGSPMNFKITTAFDLRLARLLLGAEA